MPNKRVELLKGLTQRERAYVMLCVTHPEMSYTEMAEKLNLTIAALSTRYNANPKLQDIIATFLAGRLNSLMPTAFAQFKKLIEKGDSKSIHLLMRILLKTGQMKNFDFTEADFTTSEDEEEVEDKEVGELLKEYEV